MNIENFNQELEIPQGVQVKVDKGIFTVKGPKGELVRNLQSNKIEYKVENNKIHLNIKKASKKEKTLMYTMLAHLKNCFKGVTQGFVYKLAICSGHFPMTVAYNNNELVVKNFIGESVPRKVKLSSDVSLKIDGKTIELTGIDIEKMGITASKIEKLTSRSGFDKRRFQDGIYITEKNGKAM